VAVVVDADYEPIAGVYIKNINSNRFAISNEAGQFSLECSFNDSLLITAMGYEVKKVVISELNGPVIQLKSLLQKLKPVEIYDFKSWDSFKKEFLELDVEKQEVNTEGIPDNKPSEVPVQLRSNEYAKKPSVMQRILSPFSSLSYSLNKKEKEKRKALEQIRKDKNSAAYQDVMQSDKVIELVPISLDLVDDFILFCNTKIADKNIDNEYHYIEIIIQLYPVYLEERKKQD